MHSGKKMGMDRIDGSVQIGGGDTAWKTERTGKQMPHEDFFHIGFKNPRYREFMGCIADRKFRYHTNGRQGKFSELLAECMNLFFVDGFQFPPAMVERAFDPEIMFPAETTIATGGSLSCTTRLVARVVLNTTRLTSTTSCPASKRSSALITVSYRFSGSVFTLIPRTNPSAPINTASVCVPPTSSPIITSLLRRRMKDICQRYPAVPVASSCLSPVQTRLHRLVKIVQ